MSLEDVATKVVIEFGKRAGVHEVYAIMDELGFRDEEGDLSTRVLEMVKSAVVRVKVRLA